MSLYAYIAAGFVALVLLAGTHWKAYVAGADGVRAEWSAEKVAAENQAEVLRLTRQGNINKIDAASAPKRQKQVKVDQSIIDKVETNVPSTLPLLPGSFRVQHDAAATGEEINDSSAVDAAPVAPRTVAKTVSRNYANARSNQADLEELQAIVRASGCFDIEGE